MIESRNIQPRAELRLALKEAIGLRLPDDRPWMFLPLDSDRDTFDYCCSCQARPLSYYKPDAEVACDVLTFTRLVRVRTYIHGARWENDCRAFCGQCPACGSIYWTFKAVGKIKPPPWWYE